MNEISLWPLAASIEGWKEQTYEFYLVATVMDGCNVIGSSSLLFTASGIIILSVRFIRGNQERNTGKRQHL